MKEKYSKKHKKDGLCRYCKEPIVEGKTMCQYHLDYHKFYKKFKVKPKGDAQ